MMNEEIRSIMSNNPLTVGPDDTIQAVTDLMLRRRKQQLPVVENGVLVGLITSYDLWRNLRETSCVGEGTVRDVMTTDVVKLAPKDKIGTAAELFIDQRFKTLPVVNLRGELKGVITAFDVIKYHFKKEYPDPILYREVLLE